MIAPFLFRASWGLLLNMALVSCVLSQTPQSNALSLFPESEFPWVKTLNREVDLMRSLIAETNKAFDQKICASIGEVPKKPLVVSFQQVSFIFYYPAGVSYLKTPGTEMDAPDELICTKSAVLRRATTNEIPANSIRVLDVHRKNVTAEVDVLLGVSSLDKPNDATYVRRVFRYIYEDGWKED